MGWLVYCTVLEIEFHSKPNKWLLPQYYDVPQILDPIRYRLVLEIGQFRFLRSSFWNWVVVQFYDSPHNIMMTPQVRIEWSTKFDNSGSYEVRSEMGWLVYCIVLEIGFQSKPAKWLLPQYYDVPQVLDSIRYRLVLEIGQFRFVRSSFWNGVVGVLYSSRDWISLKARQITPPRILWCSPSFGLNPISIGPWNRTIQLRTKFVLKWGGWCIV